jgi:predicted transposase/invertase (TIGR01784 family)
MADINNPHDSFFKELLSQPQNARDFLRYYLPPEIAAEFDLRQLELVRDAFVDESLQEHLADLLYRVKLKRGADAFVFVLFEHKSAPDFWVAFQILRYIVRLWEQQQAQGAKQLPPVYPIVLYHGRRRWRVARNLRSLVAIGTESPLLHFVPEFEYYLVDLTALGEEDLHGAPYLKAGLLTLKLIFDRELAQRLPEIFKAIKAGPKRPLLEHLKTVSKYLSKVKNAVEPAQIKQAVREVFSDQGDKIMAEFFQEWIDQGREQGLQQGIRQGLQQGLAQGIARGRVEGLTSLTLSLLQRRLGRIPKVTREQVRGLAAKQLEELGLALLDFNSRADLDTWLEQHMHVN